MKLTYAELQTYYANQKRAKAWTDLSESEQSEGEFLINLIRDEIWFHNQWVFCGRKQNFTLVGPYATGTVSGTAGEHTLTGDNTAWPTHVEGVPVKGQFILLGSKLYKILDRISTTKLILDGKLVATLSAGTTYAIYFLEYPLRWDVGAIRDVLKDIDSLTPRPEQMIPTDNAVGEAEIWYPAGQTEEAFATGTGTFTQNSRTVSSVGTVVPADCHIGMAITPESVFDIYYIVDKGIDSYTLDRAYTGDTLAGTNLIINPVGTPLIGFRSMPNTRDIVKVVYTKEPPRMRGNYDHSGLPTDVPLLRGIKVVVTEWQNVGEGNINEVLFQDKKFMQSLRLLQMRGGSSKLKLYSIYDLHNKQRRYRDSNR